MELRNFGAVIKFALEVEAMAAAFYETANAITKNQQLKNSFETFMQMRMTRMELLKRLRRENTTEMILEPISGLNAEKYRPKTECPEGCPDKQLIDLAVSMENLNSAFYVEAAKKIEFMIEPADIFEQMAEENMENTKQLGAFS